MVLLSLVSPVGKFAFPFSFPCGEEFPETFVDFPAERGKWEALRGRFFCVRSANRRRK